MRPWIVIVMLSALLGLQPVTTDLFLPALPQIRETLAAPMPRVQLAMSLVMLAFGAGQLVAGPLADRLGRTRVLRGGLALYALASLGAALTPSIDALVVARAAQGLGLAAGVVCARALVRDLFPADQGPHIMSRALSGLGVMALLSPIVGGAVTRAWGWRGTMACLLLYATAVLWLVWRPLPTPAAPGPAAAPPRTTLADAVRRILRHPRFLAWASLSAATYGGLFVFLSSSAFVAIEVLHATPTLYGWLLAGCSLHYLAGTAVCRRLLPHRGPVGTVKVGARFTLAGGLGMAALLVWPPQSVWAVFLPQWLYAFGHGMHQPCGQSGAVSPFPEAAGTAAALSGFLQALTAFASGLWLGQAIQAGGASALATGLVFWAALTGGIALGIVPRVDRAHPA